MRLAKYYNQRRLEGPTLKRGEKVYLLRKNLKTKRPSSKLDHVKLGPFEIQEQTGPVNFRLKLPETMRIHSVFHISLLEPAPQNAKLQTQIEIEPDEEYEVEKILDAKQEGQRMEYLIKWKGYDNSQNTWEPTKHLKKCWQMVEHFHRQNP